MLFRSPIGDVAADEDTVMEAGGDAATVTWPGGAGKFGDEGAAIIARGGEA